MDVAVRRKLCRLSICAARKSIGMAEPMQNRGDNDHCLCNERSIAIYAIQDVSLRGRYKRVDFESVRRGSAGLACKFAGRNTSFRHGLSIAGLTDAAGVSSGRLDSQFEAPVHHIGVAIYHVQRRTRAVCQALKHEQ